MSWLRDFVAYKGRLRRSQFLWRHFVVSFVGTFAGMALMFGLWTLGSDQNLAIGIATSVVMVPLMYADISLVVRRFHDVGLSGWWVTPLFAPMVVTLLLPLGWVPLEWMMWLLFPLVLVFFVILLVIPGTRGDNKYGPPDAKLD